ncbi:methyltransferase, FkbM family [Methylobacterium sp. 174MFSha1.1]|nr:methyltransferase, FkbM family [Methylobacterium sp. 174MFSha1.1]
MLFLSVQQTRVGNHDKAGEVLDAVERQFGHLRDEVEIHRQFFDFYKHYPPDIAWSLFKDVKSKFAAASIDAVERNIHRALDEKRPFLLLRLGDGEGSVIRIDKDDTNKYDAYYTANQKEFLKIWFEDESVGASDRFDKVIDDFNDVIQNADMIGGIYDAAIMHEYRLGSRRGIAWIVNTMRKVLLLAERDPDWASRTSIHHLGLHYDLLLSGTLARLLQGRPHVGVVSCQSELPAALKRTYGIGEVEFYKVPGEQIHRATLGDSAVEGAHWPDRFFKLCETFDRGADRRGQLFLVAAGMLGKVYASKLKAAGAVVLDIGAVADLWMGKITRTFPHLPDEVALRLDPDESLTVVQVGGMSDLSLGQQTQSAGGALTVFEPNPERYEQTKAFFAEQGLKVLLIGKGLSNASESRRFYIAKSLGCSSVLEPNDEILRRYSVGPAFRTVHSIDVDCVRYDELLAEGGVSMPDVLLLSAQGFDSEILDGFGDTLRFCLGVKIRTYLYEVYKNQKLMPDIVKQLDRYGFILRRMAPNDNFDGGIVEIDAWFTRPVWQLSGLSDEQKTKFKTLERAWNLPSQRIMFSEAQFS